MDQQKAKKEEKNEIKKENPSIKEDIILQRGISDEALVYWNW